MNQKNKSLSYKILRTELSCLVSWIDEMNFGEAKKIARQIMSRIDEYQLPNQEEICKRCVDITPVFGDAINKSKQLKINSELLRVMPDKKTNEEIRAMVFSKMLR